MMSPQAASQMERPTSPRGHLHTESSGSVTNLIYRVKKGDDAAAHDLFARYCRRLLGLARAKIRGKYLRIASADDVVNSALAGFFLGAMRGQYTRLHDRKDLGALLVTITVREAQRLVEEQGRRKRRPRRTDEGTGSQGLTGTLAVKVPVEQIVDRRPPPDLEVLANEAVHHLLSRLEAELRAIAIWKWEGYFNAEIAAMLGCCPRTIERKLDLIRTIWIEAGLAPRTCDELGAGTTLEGEMVK